MQPLLDALVAAACRRPPIGRSPAVDQGRRRRPRVAADRQRADHARSSGAPSPIRSPAGSRCSASSPAAWWPTPPPPTSRAATPPSGSATCCVVQGKTHTSVPEVKAGDLGAVAKLKETQSGDTLADKGATITFPPLAVPGAGAGLRHRAEDARRRGQDQQRPAPAAGRGSDDPLRPRPADQGSAALGPGPAPHRGDRRQAEAAVRRRRDAQAAARPLPRDDRRAGRGARPPQEADRRPRPVRRLQDQGRAAAARRRLRVRRRDLRRLDPAPVRAGRREGHPGGADARLPGRLSDGRLPRHRLRRLVPPGRLERAVVQDGRLAGLQGRDGAGPADAARAGDAGRGAGARASTPAT